MSKIESIRDRIQDLAKKIVMEISPYLQPDKEYIEAQVTPRVYSLLASELVCFGKTAIQLCHPSENIDATKFREKEVFRDLAEQIFDQCAFSYNRPLERPVWKATHEMHEKEFKVGIICLKRPYEV